MDELKKLERKNKDSLMVKLVIFSVAGGKLCVFLPKGKLPYGKPGKGKSLDGLAEEILNKAVGISAKDIYLEQLYTFSFQSEIVVSYYALVPEYKLLHTGRIMASTSFQPATPGVSLGIFDSRIIRYAVQRLRWKIEYTNVVYSLLPKEFTLSELRTVYEAILGRELDKRNFRKKIFSLNILKSAGKKKKLGKARPAEMFCFKKRKLKFVEVL